MVRALNTAFKAATKADNIIYGFAIEFDFPFGFIRLNSTPYTVTINGNIFTGEGDMLNAPVVKESSNISDAGISVNLAGIDNAMLLNIMGASVQYRPMAMWEIVFNADHTLMDTHQIGSWRMDTATVAAGDSSQIKIKASSLWDAWATTKELFYTDGDQQSRHPGDTFFAQLIPDIDKSIIWGRV